MKIPFLKRGFQKIVFETNGLMTKIFLRDFESHPETKPLETNPNLGVGNGHAQSRDLSLLVPFLVILRMLGCKSILDLGSGDGFVLRIAESIGYSKCYGIEADLSLCQISRMNLNRSVIYNQYFSDVKVEYFEKPIHLIYIFNPDLPLNMLEVCLKLRSLDCKYFLTKNLVFTSEAAFQLNIRLVWGIASYRLYRATENSI